ncbi:SDR family NAD(P)-dependent oxidoreductase [Actinomadura physcomitrii]|uniref:SDR family NAD(P)-dependent oxidoreductase n=1 Tax=Actinomadura physcomitrii TaxID=2650748 RepID=UPI00136E2AD0|nr:SDR family oxidoreductase [Actinomadura physcomitrii]
MSTSSAFSLNARVAVVTGANSGIGRGIAEALANAGARVVVSGRTKARNAEVVEAITAAGGEAVAVEADVTREEDVVGLIGRTVDAFGQLDICVANSGGILDVGDAPFVDMEYAMWRDAMALNLDGVFLFYREALRVMIPAGRGGALIGVSSISSMRSLGGAVHFNAAKGGMNSLSQGLVDYVGRHGIRINTIVPGFVETATTAHILSQEDVRAGIERRIPIGRVGVPADIGGLAVYLASDQSGYITGTTVVADGGQSQMMPCDAPAG